MEEVAWRRRSWLISRIRTLVAALLAEGESHRACLFMSAINVGEVYYFLPKRSVRTSRSAGANPREPFRPRMRRRKKIWNEPFKKAVPDVSNVGTSTVIRHSNLSAR